MTALVTWDEGTFRAMYSSGAVGEGEPALTYGVEYWGQPSVAHYFDWRALGLLDLGVTGRVLVAGAAWGHLCRSLRELGIQAVGVDSSPFVAAHRHEHLGLVIDADVRQLTPDDLPWVPDWVVTESVLESYDADDAASVVDACHRLAPNVAHLVYEDLKPPFRSQSLDVWRLEDADAVWASIDAWGLA